MYYVLWTSTGSEEKTRQMIRDYVGSAYYSRIAIPYRKKKYFHGGKATIVKELIFPSYIFIETDHIKDFAKRMQWYPGKNVILQSGDSFCPIYREEEYFLTDMLDEKDIIESSNGYMEGERVTVTSGPLKGYEDKIRRVIRRKSLAIMEMTLYDRKVETALGLDLS